MNIYIVSRDFTCLAVQSARPEFLFSAPCDYSISACFLERRPRSEAQLVFTPLARRTCHAYVPIQRWTLHKGPTCMMQFQNSLYILTQPADWPI